MRVFLSLFVIISLLFLVCSCALRSESPYVLMDSFMHEYRGTGTVYSTKCREGEVGFITDSVRQQLFTNPSLAPMEYAIYTYSRLDTVTEVGMLTTFGAADRLDISRMCLDRIELLSGFSEGEGEVIFHSGIIIYYYSSDPEVFRALEKIT